MPRAYATNRLVSHLAYPKILHAYNERLARDGKVNAKKFFEEFVSKEIPSYTISAWYQFLKRFKGEAGLVAPSTTTPAVARVHPAAITGEEQVAVTMLTNNEALQKSIAAALNISASALQDILENPELIPAEKRAELFLKVMKAQDSRVKAVGAIRADNREQERFDRAMDSATFA